MIVTSVCAIKEHRNLPDFFDSSPICPHNFSFRTLSLYFLTCHVIPYIYIPVLLIFQPFLKNKQAALVASKHSKCSRGDVGLFTLSESSRLRPVRTRSVTSNNIALRRRRSSQCEDLRLITHEKILLNGDVPRRNGNVTYSVNQPLAIPGGVMLCASCLEVECVPKSVV